MRRNRLLSTVLSILWLAASGIAGADLIQHLDATVSGSVTGSPVSQWADQSSYGNDAANDVGNVYYPSSSLSASGLAGLDFQATRNSLRLFDASGQDTWLNQTSGSGFCVLVAFKCDAVHTDWNDLIGNNSVVNSGFGLRYSNAGVMQGYLGGGSFNKSGAAVSAGDTIVYAFNYNASTGSYEFWDSKNDGSMTGSVVKADFSTSNAVTLGSTVNSARYFKGMVGEVKIYDSVLGAIEFVNARDALVTKWIGGGGGSGWRVIPEDAAYPTDDIIVAICEVTDPVYNLPSRSRQYGLHGGVSGCAECRERARRRHGFCACRPVPY